MDNIANERFRKLEDRLTRVESNTGKLLGQVSGLEKRVLAKLDNVSVRLEGEITQGLAGAVSVLDERAAKRHAEQMGKFQSVVTEAERIGAATAHDARFAELEARMAKIEELLSGGSKQ